MCGLLIFWRKPFVYYINLKTAGELRVYMGIMSRAQLPAGLKFTRVRAFSLTDTDTRAHTLVIITLAVSTVEDGVKRGERDFYENKCRDHQKVWDFRFFLGYSIACGAYLCINIYILVV